jgi:hypothetical protein
VRGERRRAEHEREERKAVLRVEFGRVPKGVAKAGL